VLFNPFVDVNAVAKKVGTTQSLATAQAITDKSITVLSNDGTLPLKAKSVLVTGWGVTTTQTLADALTAQGIPASKTATDYDAIVVTTNGAATDPAQQQKVRTSLRPQASDRGRRRQPVRPGRDTRGPHLDRHLLVHGGVHAVAGPSDRRRGRPARQAARRHPELVPVRHGNDLVSLSRRGFLAASALTAAAPARLGRHSLSRSGG